MLHYFDLLKNALDQGLSVVPEVNEFLQDFEKRYIVALRKSLKLRRKHAEERRELEKKGQRLITGFVQPHASCAVSGPRSKEVAATAGASPCALASKRRRTSILEFMC